MSKTYSRSRSRVLRGRGLAQASKDLITAARTFLETAHPTTVRGVAYHLFTQGLIRSMSESGKVSHLLKIAREQDQIPWEWLVDETRALEQIASWDDPQAFINQVRWEYTKNLWCDQPRRVEVWSEKGTVRGVLGPVLDELGVGFRVMHGFSSATVMHDIATSDAGRPLIALYVGDWDPSGLYMSEVDLPRRLRDYGGDHVSVRRIALRKADGVRLPSFSAHTKRGDTRYRWFTTHRGVDCWELDAMHPNVLRKRVRDHIRALIEPVAWARGERAAQAEHDSLEDFFDRWSKFKTRQDR